MTSNAPPLTSLTATHLDPHNTAFARWIAERSLSYGGEAQKIPVPEWMHLGLLGLAAELDLPRTNVQHAAVRYGMATFAEENTDRIARYRRLRIDRGTSAHKTDDVSAMGPYLLRRQPHDEPAPHIPTILRVNGEMGESLSIMAYMLKYDKKFIVRGMFAYVLDEFIDYLEVVDDQPEFYNSRIWANGALIQ